ncbi:HK97 family phage prohead protease [Mesorhizobium sp. A623]
MERIIFETKMDAGDEGVIEGTAWDFGTPDRIGDMIEPGGMKSVFPLPLLFGHDTTDPLGTIDSATEKGGKLHFKARLLIADVPRAAQVWALSKAGAVRGFSMGFNILKSVERRAEGRVVGRLIKQWEWLEGSLVSIPMHPGARVTSAKSVVEAFRMAEAINRATAHMKGK